MSTLVAPVARTVVTSVCMPAAAKGTSAQGLALTAVLPFFQQDQALGLLPVLPVNGSLKRSKITAELLLNVLATEVQKAGAWSRSGIASCLLACVVPGAAQCRSRMTTKLFEVSRLT